MVLASGGDPSYQYVYREAAEIYWDSNTKAFKSPPPNTWSYSDWFHQIIKVTRNCNIILSLSNETTWVNVPLEVKNKILMTNLY